MNRGILQMFLDMDYGHHTHNLEYAKKVSEALETAGLGGTKDSRDLLALFIVRPTGDVMDALKPPVETK